MRLGEAARRRALEFDQVFTLPKLAAVVNAASAT